MRGQPREQPAEHAVADDQGPLAGHDAGQGVVGGRCQGDETGAVAERGIDGDEARGRSDQVRGCAAEQPVDCAEAAGAGHEHGLSDAQATAGLGLDHRADRLVAGHQRIPHAGKGWHPAGPEQALGPRADAAPGDGNGRVALSRGGERETVERQVLRSFKDDGQRFHLPASPAAGCDAAIG